MLNWLRNFCRKLYDPQEDTETQLLALRLAEGGDRKLYDPQEDTETGHAPDH